MLRLLVHCAQGSREGFREGARALTPGNLGSNSTYAEVASMSNRARRSTGAAPTATSTAQGARHANERRIERVVVALQLLADERVPVPLRDALTASQYLQRARSIAEDGEPAQVLYDLAVKLAADDL